MNGTVLFERRFPEGLFRVYDGDPQDSQLVVAKQTHSVFVLPADTVDLANQEADGVYGSWAQLKDRLIAVKTADCLPVLLLGKNGAAVVHAGWRGLAHGILQADELQELAVERAFIGPCIHECCFEVTEEFAAHFPYSTLIKRGTKHYFDLVAEARGQLLRTFPALKVEDSGECTYCQSRYSSFRRDKTTRRIWNCFIPLAE